MITILQRIVLFIILIVSTLFSLELKAQCINYVNLEDTNIVTCYYGSYINPYANIGIKSGRHTIKTNVSETDPLTQNQLTCIPPGDTISVKLGDSINRDATAEAITYKIHIDTNDFSLLYIKYAIVLHDYGHPESQQPKFKIQILDTLNQLIFPTCGDIYFSAGDTTQWNICSVGLYNAVNWKNWTTLGFDLSQFHNLTIVVRLTTYDCAFSWDFGYAYFTMACGKKEIKVMTCGVSNATLTAPPNFNYKWYNTEEPQVIISTNQILTVPINGDNYTCECSFKTNPSCKFTLSATAQLVFPMANFTYGVRRADGCIYKVNFENLSSTSLDGVTPNTADAECESYKWYFHDGFVSFDKNPIKYYNEKGSYPVKLVAYLTEGGCSDTIDMSVIIDRADNSLEIKGDTIICDGSQTTLTASNERISYLWSTQDTTQSIILNPQLTTPYSVATVDSFGCQETAFQMVYVMPNYNDTIYEQICEGDIFLMFGFSEYIPGFYTHSFQSIYGCDSIRNLSLSIPSTPVINLEQEIQVEEYPITLDATCENCLTYRWNTGDTTPVIIVNGCGNYYVSADYKCGSVYASTAILDPDINIFIPNAFTPKEGANNIFMPKLSRTEDIKIESFVVYNKWGTSLFYTNENNKGWDGTYKGQLCQSETYVWRLLYRTKYSGNKIFEKTGEVNLIK